MFRLLCGLFVFLIPFYDVPKTFREGITASIVLGIIILLMLIVRYLATRNESIFKYPVTLIVPFFIFYLVYFISYALNLDTVNDKAANHVLFYLLTFLIYTLVTNTVIRMYGTEWFAKVLSYAVIAVSLIGFYEMFLYYTGGMGAYANFLHHGTNVGIFNGFPRLRSTFNEPSHYALFMICAIPVLWHGKQKLATVLGIVSLFLTFSATMFLGVFVAAVYYGATLLTKPNVIKRIVPILLFALPLVLLFGRSSIIMGMVDQFRDVSASDPYRYSAFHAALSRFGDYFFIGLGPASYYDQPLLHWGVFNWYLQVMYESGVLALIALVALIFFSYKNAVKSKIPFAAFSVIAFAVQMVSMEHYYIPGFWILISFVSARVSDLNKEPAIEIKQVERVNDNSLVLKT